MLPESDTLRVVTDDKKFTIQRRLRGTSGILKWLSDKMSPNGDFIGRHLTLADVTKLKQCWKSGSAVRLPGRLANTLHALRRASPSCCPESRHWSFSVSTHGQERYLAA